MSRCAPFVQGVLAYSNSDLISNGFIPRTGTARDREVRVIPASRMAIELQYSVRSRVTGTTLNNLVGGAGLGGLLGTLGGGAGFILGQSLGASLIGDLEPTQSTFIFHLTEADTRINRAITVTEEMLRAARSSGGVIRHRVNDYIIGVLGVTRTPIVFTNEEQENIGAATGARRGWSVTQDGAVLASFGDFDPSSERNLFVKRVIDERKFDFRGDNYLSNDESQVFINNGEDDLTDRIIEIKFPQYLLATGNREPGDPLPSNKEEAEKAPLVAGDRIYITYSAATNRLIRQAILVKSFFFLFPGGIVERIGEDEVQAWNFRPYEFKVLKNHNVKFATNPVRANIRDLQRDETILKDETLTDEQKSRQLRTENIESMRLVEVLNNSRTNRPFIKGFYAIDIRGIISVSGLKTGSERVDVLIPAQSIRDQQWWNSVIGSFDLNRPGYTNGELVDPSRANSVLRGFVFDVSNHVNALCFDSEKLGYQRELAEAISRVSRPDPEDNTKGVGFPNLDLIYNRLPDRNKYDLSSAVFEPMRMSSIEGGSYFVRDCNKFFTNQTVQADMFIRTPFFFDNFGERTRVYVERFTPQFPMERDGGIWVFSTPSTSIDQSMTVDEHPYNKLSYLVFNADNADGDSTLRYFKFEDNILRNQLYRTELDPIAIDRIHEKSNIDEVTQDSVKVLGYDFILGNQPGYSGGREISTDKGKIALGKRTASDTYEIKSLDFVQNSEEPTVTVSGLMGAKTTSIKIKYGIKPGFLRNPNRLMSLIFPNEGNVIDNIAVPWVGDSTSFGEYTIVIDTRNHSDELFRLNGDVVRYMDIRAIDAVVFKEEAYQQCKVVSSISSTCFDKSGNWFLFYEDDLAFEGEYGDQPIEIGIEENKEISCLFSPDEGDTWIDFKGIVQTFGNEKISDPLVISNQSTNSIHLFCIINDALVHKSISPKLFDASDAFKAYRRPLAFTEGTDELAGLSHFTEDGIQLRQSPLNIVIGNVRGEYLSRQLSISSSRRLNNLFPRITLNGDLRDFDEGFASQDYFVFQDKKGSLNVVYAANGAVFVRTSNDEGRTWEEVYKEETDIFIHKNSSIQEAREVSHIGGVYDPKTGNINIAYIVDEMMFYKSFDGSFLTKDYEFLRQLNEGKMKGSLSPIFIVGNIPDELRSSIASGDPTFKFPYPRSSTDIFNENMGISSVSPVGYVSSSGITRMFYKDSFGNIRGLCFEGSQVQLDTKRRGI